MKIILLLVLLLATGCVKAVTEEEIVKESKITNVVAAQKLPSQMCREIAEFAKERRKKMEEENLKALEKTVKECKKAWEITPKKAQKFLATCPNVEVTRQLFSHGLAWSNYEETSCVQYFLDRGNLGYDSSGRRL